MFVVYGFARVSGIWLRRASFSAGVADFLPAVMGREEVVGCWFLLRPLGVVPLRGPEGHHSSLDSLVPADCAS